MTPHKSLPLALDEIQGVVTRIDEDNDVAAMDRFDLKQILAVRDLALKRRDAEE